MTTASAHRFIRLCALLILICAAALLLPWGRPALGAETDESPCMLTDEQRAAYEADGTLEARIAYQESLRNDRPSEGLISQAVERERAAQGIGAYAVPSNWSSGMASVGAAHVLGLIITFPDHLFEENDTLDAFQSIIGPKTQNGAAPAGTSPFPYESLSAYYYRASYGKLSLTGETFDYAAKYERDYYTNNPESLVAEALAALDESEDLSRFDANEDGKLDAVYVHFAGPDTGWGSVWWSNESTASDPTLYEDGSVRLWNMILLAENSSNSWAARTIIHETGHVLGLPDYYSARSQTGQGSDHSGILTFDMMMQNMGDHNGYSKWLVGWLPEEKITRIVANEDGISVTRNGEVLEHHDAVDGDTPSVDATLGAYADDDASETGASSWCPIRIRACSPPSTSSNTTATPAIKAFATLMRPWQNTSFRRDSACFASEGNSPTTDRIMRTATCTEQFTANSSSWLTPIWTKPIRQAASIMRPAPSERIHTDACFSRNRR